MSETQISTQPDGSVRIEITIPADELSAVTAAGASSTFYVTGSGGVAGGSAERPQATDTTAAPDVEPAADAAPAPDASEEPAPMHEASPEPWEGR